MRKIFCADGHSLDGRLPTTSLFHQRPLIASSTVKFCAESEPPISRRSRDLSIFSKKNNINFKSGFQRNANVCRFKAANELTVTWPTNQAIRGGHVIKFIQKIRSNSFKMFKSFPQLDTRRVVQKQPMSQPTGHVTLQSANRTWSRDAIYSKRKKSLKMSK